jgi:hypothetical protein
VLFIDFKGKGPPAMGGFFYGEKWGVFGHEYTNSRNSNTEIPNYKLRAHFLATQIINIS